MHFRRLLFVGLLTVSAGVGAQSISEKAAKDEVVVRSNDDPAMRKALSRAAETLPEFLMLASNPKAGTARYALKVGISDGRNTEYFWVNSFSRNGDSFAGTLNNEPRLVKIHKIGDRISFTQKQIADWTYVDESNNRMVGNFTACALLSKELPAQAAAFKQQYGLYCEE
jgi:uncharacterized protein YegJ (DUF2314 family)